MTPLALGFMIISWTFVLGLTTWCFSRVLRSERKGSGKPAGPDGGPADHGVGEEA